MSKPLQFFIAGIIQGSLQDTSHPQDYRTDIATLLKKHFPDAEIFDPVVCYPDSLNYTDKDGSNAFFDLMERAGRVDIVIAFLPEASMGTAIELWNAYNSGALVVCVTEMKKNWVIRFLSDLIVPNLESLKDVIASGELTALFEETKL